jgi:hypothetical protein
MNPGVLHWRRCKMQACSELHFRSLILKTQTNISINSASQSRGPCYSKMCCTFHDFPLLRVVYLARMKRPSGPL